MEGVNIRSKTVLNGLAMNDLQKLKNVYLRTLFSNVKRTIATMYTNMKYEFFGLFKSKGKSNSEFISLLLASLVHVIFIS